MCPFPIKKLLKIKVKAKILAPIKNLKENFKNSYPISIRQYVYGRLVSSATRVGSIVVPNSGPLSIFGCVCVNVCSIIMRALRTRARAFETFLWAPLLNNIELAPICTFGQWPVWNLGTGKTSKNSFWDPWFSKKLAIISFGNSQGDPKMCTYVPVCDISISGSEFWTRSRAWSKMK